MNEQNIQPIQTPISGAPLNPSSSVSAHDRYLALSHYIPLVAPLTCFYLLLQKNLSSFSLFHLKQGLALFLCWFFSIFVLALFPFLGFLFILILLIMSIWGCIASYQGMNVEIPVVIFLTRFLPIDKVRQIFLGTL